MKYVVIVATICVLVCSVSCFRSPQPGEIAPHLFSRKAADHRVAKRQSSPSAEMQDAIDCTVIALDYDCSSGYLQGLADVALDCRNVSYARDIANACSRSEGGGFCATETFRLTADTSGSLAASALSCTGAVFAGSCPSSCSSFLQSVSSRLGCCINTYVNTTESGLLDLFGEYVDYNLWRLCNVPLPASSCGDTTPLNPPQGAQQCTLQQLFNRFSDYACMPSVGQPFIDTLQQNSKCSDIAQAYVDDCSVNENNEFCVAVIGTDFLSGLSSADPLYISLFTNCNTSSGIFCSSSCQSAISEVSNSYGCCVNVLNDTDSSPELSYGLWNRCGVQPPGDCATGTLKLNGATTERGFAWLVTIAMALYMALCA